MADDDVIRIPLRARDGSVSAWAIVDREDADLADLRWKQSQGYSVRTIYGADTPSGYSNEKMHRVILSRAKGRQLHVREECDHVNGNRLDNRRSNLRIATHGENAVNRGGYGESMYMGVHRSRKGWRARILPLGSGRANKDKCRINLGTFAAEEDAASAYDRAAREHHGEYARLNFPDGGDA